MASCDGRRRLDCENIVESNALCAGESACEMCRDFITASQKKKARRAEARLYAFMLFASSARMRTEYQLKFEWNKNGNWESQWGRDINLFDRDVMCCAGGGVGAFDARHCFWFCHHVYKVVRSPAVRRALSYALCWTVRFSTTAMRILRFFDFYSRNYFSFFFRSLVPFTRHSTVVFFEPFLFSILLSQVCTWELAYSERVKREQKDDAQRLHTLTDSLGERCCCRMHGQPIAKLSTAHEEICMRLRVGVETHGRCLGFWFSRTVFDGGGYSSAAAQMNSLKGKPSPFPVKMLYGLI